MVELRLMVELLVAPAVKVTLVGLRVAVRPEGDAVDERETVPAKPFMLVRLILALVAAPVMTLMLVGAEILKSTTFTATVTEWVREPLVPFTTTL